MGINKQTDRRGNIAYYYKGTRILLLDKVNGQVLESVVLPVDLESAKDLVCVYYTILIEEGYNG